MTSKAYQIEYQEAEVKQGYKPRKNSETSEPFWKTDRDWKEFHIVRLLGGDKNRRK